MLQIAHVPLASLVASIALVGGAAVTIVATKRETGVELLDSMGSPEWDFGKSWASNIAVFGTVVTAFFQASTAFKNEPVYIDSALLCAALVVAAPLAFMVSRKGDARIRGTPVHGSVIAFLVSCFATAWGALGQIGVLYCATDRLSRSKEGPEVLAWLQWALIVSGLLLAVHICRSAYWTVISQAGPRKLATGSTEEVQGRELKSWPLL